MEDFINFLDNRVNKEKEFYKEDLFIKVKDNNEIQTAIVNKIKEISDQINYRQEKMDFWGKIYDKYSEIFDLSEIQL